jgi:putative redox protein
MPRVTVRLQDGLQAVITAGNHTWVSDEPIIDGGTDTGPSPTEMLLGSLGACMVMTARLYALRKKWPLEQVEVDVEYHKFNGADYPAYQGESPFVYEFREHVVFHGDLSDEQKARLAEISKKCPVRRILQSPAFFVEKQPDTSV